MHVKCIYIYNPNSGRQNNAKIESYVVEKLKTKYEIVDIKPTTKRGDAGVFAREACGKYDTIVISGGDGTVNEIINAIAPQEQRPKIGYIPTGTTNDLAHSLKIPKNVKKAVDIILKGNSTTHDIFKVNDKYGIYVCAFGVFTGSSYTTSQKSKKKFGKLAYYRYGIKEFFNTKNFNMTLKFDDVEISSKYALGIIANSKYISGYKINKMASCNDGYVNVILVKDKKKKGISFKALFRIAKLFLFGVTKLKSSKNCQILKLNKFSVELPKNTIINLDGEKGFEGSFNFEVLNQHVEIFVKG